MSESSEGRLHRLWNSSIGPKIVMGLTGLIGAGFVLGHLAGNLQVYLGSDVFNSYAHFLQSTPEILWPTRITLIVAVILHVAAAVRLTKLNWEARPHAYAAARKYGHTSYAALFMRGSGLLLLAFIVFHILHFTVGAVQHEAHDAYEVLKNGVWVPAGKRELLDKVPEALIRHDAHRMFITGFKSVPVAATYIVATLMLASHLRHGVASMLATLGLGMGRGRLLAERASASFAAFIALGNLSFPIAVQAGLLTL